jgi:hypothetical protein
MTDIELKLKELIELDINDLEELELIEELYNDIIN